ncbi:MAG TPA: hypothetical protein EYP10_01035 [Armatimonadetes bacterium]|nr:hypothetical protein [Armatimonadota bacterium]
MFHGWTPKRGLQEEVKGAMPVYEYACTACEHHFDVEHSAYEHPDVVCPKCGASARKVFRPVPIIFKGSGWHVTDYGPTGPKSSSGNGNKGKKEKVEDKGTKEKESTTVGSE